MTDTPFRVELRGFVTSRHNLQILRSEEQREINYQLLVHVRLRCRSAITCMGSGSTNALVENANWKEGRQREDTRVEMVAYPPPDRGSPMIETDPEALSQATYLTVCKT